MSSGEDDMILAGHSADEGSDDDDDNVDDEDDEYIVSADSSGMMAGLDGGATGGKNHGEEEFVYEVLSSEQIVEHMTECIRDVNTVVQIPSTITRILLSHFMWDREKLMECYYDGDQEKLFSEAHVISPFRSINASATASAVESLKAGSSKATPSSSGVFKSGSSILKSPSTQSAAASSSTTGTLGTNSKTKRGMRSSPTPSPPASTTSNNTPGSTTTHQSPFTCEICFLEVPENLTGLECGHKFCSHCWTYYLTTKIMDEGMGQTIMCAAHDCDILVDDETVMNLISEPAVKLKYQHLITNSFVECNRLLMWCPKPNCGNAIRVQCCDCKPVTCSCGFTFCFSCGEAWHDPVKCLLLKKWIKKCDSDSETSSWIAANTRECPKCHATIEKDGGCNHMVCKRCKFDFCWVCLGPWEPHGSSWYNCNRYNEDEAKKARDAQEKSRAALQRYVFFCNRYLNHMQSLKFENKLYRAVQVKMEEMQRNNMSWIEVQFLKKAVDVLCQCRQTLMYTYVFAYYLRRNNQSMIFEDNQKDLENATEQLSEYLERDITMDMLADIKQKVQDKYRYCESRRKVLLDHVHEGYERDLWDNQELENQLTTNASPMIVAGPEPKRRH